MDGELSLTDKRANEGSAFKAVESCVGQRVASPFFRRCARRNLGSWIAELRPRCVAWRGLRPLAVQRRPLPPRCCAADVHVI